MDLNRGERPVDHVRDEQTVTPDECLQYRIDSQGMERPVHYFPTQVASQSEAAHEGGEYGGDGILRVAHDQREQSRPHHFIDQPGSPGDQKKEIYPDF